VANSQIKAKGRVAVHCSYLPF